MSDSTLEQVVRRYSRIAVAHSGGLDSTVLLAFCAKILGADNCLAVSATSPYMMASETVSARQFCNSLCVARVEVDFPVSSAIRNNPSNRCYLCKRGIFGRLLTEAHSRGFETLADGTNSDDLSDYRPGMAALRELSVASPFLEAGFGKSEIRSLARVLCPDYADRPAYACLMTRFETGAEVSDAALRMVDDSEAFLRSRGFPSVRVRVHGDCARVEVPPERLADFCTPENMAASDAFLRRAGFAHTSVDMRGYVRGSMNTKKGL